jgi:hypothetical protein
MASNKWKLFNMETKRKEKNEKKIALMFAFCYYNFIHDSSFCNLSEKEYSSSK